MNKPFLSLVFAVVFFSIKSFGGNLPSLLTAKKTPNHPATFTIDTAKKATVSDTGKKAKDDDTSDDDSRSYAIGLTYGNNQAYHGIHSNEKLPYIEPNFTYTAPSGFYTELFDQYLLRGGSKYNAFAATPGWNIDLTDNTTLNFNYTHYFLGSNPPAFLISSDVSNSFETYIEQWIGKTKGRLSLDYDAYKKTAKVKTPNDFLITPDIEHDFNITLSKKSSISINPEGEISFGTRNASSHYAANSGADTVLSGQAGKLSRMQQKELQAQQEKQETDNKSFGTLSYTLTLGVDYTIGNFDAEPAYNYNVSLYNTPGASNKPLGYFTIALTYTIY